MFGRSSLLLLLSLLSLLLVSISVAQPSSSASAIDTSAASNSAGASTTAVTDSTSSTASSSSASSTTVVNDSSTPQSTATTGSSTTAATSYWCDNCANPVVKSTLSGDYCLCLFATVKTPRVLDIAPNGDVFVGSPKVGTPGITNPGVGGVYVLADADLNGVADDAKATFLTGASSAHGVLLTADALLYTDDSNVYSVPYSPGQRRAKLSDDGVTPADRKQIASLKAERFTHTLAKGPDGKLYVSTGRYDSGTCDWNDDPRLGAVLRIGGSEPLAGTVVVQNCRNPMYINCQSWACYAMELSGDGWTFQNGAEKLIKWTSADTKPVDVGYPCCVRKGQREEEHTPDSETCDRVSESEFEFHLGDTPFQFDWDKGRNFPAPFTGALFIAMHGAFQSWTNAGVQVLPWDAAKQRPMAGAKPIQLIPNGFGHGGNVFDERAGGRVSGLKFHPDGRLFFSDDVTGRIWWVAPKTLRRTGTRTPVSAASASMILRGMALLLAMLVSLA